MVGVWRRWGNVRSHWGRGRGSRLDLRLGIHRGVQLDLMLGQQDNAQNENGDEELGNTNTSKSPSYTR